jgi:hypothetical protein
MVNAPGGGSLARARAFGPWLVGVVLALSALIAPRSTFAQAVAPSTAELVHNGGFGSFTPCVGCNGPSIPAWDVFAAPYDVDPATGALSVLQAGTTQSLVRHHVKNVYAGARSPSSPPVRGPPTR